MNKHIGKGKKFYKDIEGHLYDKAFLKELNMKSHELESFLYQNSFEKLCFDILETSDEDGRFSAKKVESVLRDLLGNLCVLSDGSRMPEEGWIPYSYQYVLKQLFPDESSAALEIRDREYRNGRLLFLQIMKAIFRYERTTAPFNPTIDIRFLRNEEVLRDNCIDEYKKFDKLARSLYIYEFMRFGTELTPFNTLGHIAGVHYVAMHVARQLSHLGAPVDLGLVSGTAAGHDIGKYGCKKSEEKRIPYLHYYYTDLCFNRFNMPVIGYIAANHSTWDLELENLSVESLILIYSDFRVKSSRNSDGIEIVHFYSLADAFQVILDKLDNVDEKKYHRYINVYNKLKDFEDYMIDLGVDVGLPEIPKAIPQLPKRRERKDIALLDKKNIVREYKYASVSHNIGLMSIFYKEDKFGNLLETARSEKQWKALRTYVSIFGEYSTYMTEKQKLMTLRFLMELLTHKESDIRNQVGDIIGLIIARFNDEYKKELPQGVLPPKRQVTSLSVWEEVLNTILDPDYKLTDQHKKWMGNSLRTIIHGILFNCRAEMRGRYLEKLMVWFKKDDLSSRNRESLLQVALTINPDTCSPRQRETILSFIDSILQEEDIDLKIAAIRAKIHYKREGTELDYADRVQQILGIDKGRGLSKNKLSEMYLDNLKAKTPWTIKIANIQLMLKYLRENPDKGQELHVATHLGNLVKVSETVTVRKAAGAGLVSIIGRLPFEQRNEIAVELGKGLEIGDYQFSKYIPNYLGIILLHLKPQELDEMMIDLGKFLEGTNGKVAASVLHTFGVMLEHYKRYSKNFAEYESIEETRARKYRIIYMLVRGCANYNHIISQEALWTIGTHIFGSKVMSLEEKYEIFNHCGKKLLTIFEDTKEEELDFFNNAAVFNHIYRFICQYEAEKGGFEPEENNNVAFFPGTFDPFSLSHKQIAKEIRNMGFDVYLALDEFSWSKKTQPRLQRKKILTMSVADQEGIYIFPDDIPINIANPKDLEKLKALFKGKNLYFVAGSDVIENASSYKAEPSENSIHSLNHIIFKRASNELLGGSQKKPYKISGKVINLSLEEYFEDISSTRIRENIDLNRDIANLIDPVAQNYIYENNLYLREPAYKHILQARDIRLEEYTNRDKSVIEPMSSELEKRGYHLEKIRAYLDMPNVNTLTIGDGAKDGKTVAVASAKRLDSIDLLKEFKDPEIATYIRSKAVGAVGVIGGLFYSKKSSLTNLGQILLTELLAELLRRDYTYAVYNPCDESGLNARVVEILENQGFVNIAPRGNRPIYAVDMKAPVLVFKNVDTVIKNPLNKSPQVLGAVEEAHRRLLQVLTKIYPGELIMSFNSGIMHHKMINLIAKLNNVSPFPTGDKIYGPNMAVPFGKILEGVAVPNTVTKALHTEKYFYPDVSSFTIEESNFYAPLDHQIKTIKSFNRPVILIDDLLHKGYRMNKLDPILKANNVSVVETVIGVQTGRGRDLMTMKERTVDSAYFMPNIKCWIDETASYPFLGGDGIKEPKVSVGSQDVIPSINLVLPFTVPSFLGNISGRSMYDYSMACLENAKDILKTLEEEYQNQFERKLTLKRLGEVLTYPKRPDLGSNVLYDENIAPSAYVEKDIERLVRLRKTFRD